MEDYVLDYIGRDDYTFRKCIGDYAKLLKSKPTLSMFVPCDDDGNVLGEQKVSHGFDVHGEPIFYIPSKNKLEQYLTSLDKVIFGGWSVDENDEAYTILTNNSNKIGFFYDGTIEFNYKYINTLSDLTPYNLTLKNKL